MSRELILIGGGGHCRACIDVIEAISAYEIVGIIDQKEKIGARIHDYEIIGSDDDLLSIISETRSFHISLGQIKNPDRRRGLFEFLTMNHAVLPVIISPHAYVSPRSEIGAGTIVMHHALINAAVQIDHNCIINSGATIEHDTIIGSHCHISTGAVINGMCSIGSASFIGSRSVVANGLTIGENIVVGAGTTVINDLIEPGVYVGNPARRIIKS